MSFELSIFNENIVKKQAVSDIIKTNENTCKYGVVLTSEQAIALIQTKTNSLKNNGRIELSSSIVPKIILAFCDSPYISKDNYEDILHELIEIFYYFKNETSDKLNDDALIDFMKNSFNKVCKGSVDLLSGQELPILVKNLKLTPNSNI